jgi:hypothetical protein
VEMLTRKKIETYDQYILRLNTTASVIEKEVKISDLIFNIYESENQKALSKVERERLAKYKLALFILEGSK